jgi:uracil-DNA glycosylase family 4
MAVYPDGSSTSPYAIVGEAPGKEEVFQGKGFVGPSGKILWPLLGRKGIIRALCYVSNWSKEPLPESKKTKGLPPELIEANNIAIRAELAEIPSPRILLVGAWITKAVLSDIPEYRDWPIEMEWCHGQWFEWRGKLVMPCWHPASALYSSDSLQWTNEDIEAFVEKTPTPTWPVLTTQIYLKSLRGYHGSRCAIDTEGYVSKPYTVQVAFSPHHAWLGRADDPVAMAELRAFLPTCPLVIFHHALHDLEVLAAPPISIDLDKLGVPYTDTMNMAYVQGEAGQSLKTLARRHLRWYMKDYDDLVRPYHEAIVRTEARNRLDSPSAYDLVWKEQKTKAKNPKPPRLEIVKTRETVLIENALRSENHELLAERVGISSSPEMIPFDELKVYGCRDALSTYALYVFYQMRLSARDQAVLAHDIAVKPYLRRMHQVGLAVDKTEIECASVVVESELSVLKDQAIAEGFDINFNSGDQVAIMLDTEGKNGFESKRRTKTGRQSTGKKSLKAAEKNGSRVAYYTIRIRELGKLKGTYLEKIEGFLWEDERMHPNIRDTRVPSGRLAMYSPNLMAFPKRGERGLLVRRCVVPALGRVIGSWDLSQIELRVLADESRDERMVRAFLEGRDLHQETADNLRIPRNPCAKVMNFLIVYGGGPEKFLEEMAAEGQSGWDIVNARQALDDWFRLYPGVKKYRLVVADEIRQTGGARDALGRFRRLPAIYLPSKNWPCGKLHEEAIRQGVNHKIQGRAQQVEKNGMKHVWDYVIPSLQPLGFYEPLLQIHDELLFELDEDLWDLANSLMLEALCSDSNQFVVPILAEGKKGRNWADLSK